MPIKFSGLKRVDLSAASKIVGLYADSSSESGSSNCIINAGDFATSTRLTSEVERLDRTSLHKEGDEIVAGSKTFNNITTFNEDVISNGITTAKNYLFVKSDTLDVANAPTSTNTLEFNWKDKNDTVFGVDCLRTDTSGNIYRYMHVKAHNSNSWAAIGVGFDQNDNWYTVAPTPAVTDNSTKIATTNWCIELMKRIYPVGSIYIGTQATCPMASVIPGSTWTLVAANKALWTGSGSNANTTIDAGLPNITGKFTLNGQPASNVSCSGVFSNIENASATKLGITGGEWKKDGKQYDFNASRSSSIYGNSNTVQPPAYVVNVWRRTA